MQIPLTISKKMNENDEQEKAERRLIRMPEECRKKYCIEVGDYLSIRATQTGKVVALQVAPAYIIDAEFNPLTGYVTEEIFELLKVENIEEEGREVDLVEGITLGCDPEFFIVDRTSSIVPASRFFRRWATVGYDGLMVEIRPLPSIDEYAVAHNIMGLFNQARDTLNGTKKILGLSGKFIETGRALLMLAASSHQGISAGFHLHFGLPSPLLGKYKIGRELLASQMVKALDFYVGIPAIIPEGENDCFRRTFIASTYGKPGNFILDDRTLEYRVPGGSLLRHPILTAGILGLGAIVIEDVVSRMRAITEGYQLLETMFPSESLNVVYPNIPSPGAIYQAVVCPNTALAEAYLPTIIKDVRQMVGYERRAKSVEAYFEAIKTPFSNNIEENWRNYYERQPRPLDIFPTSV